MMKACNDVYCVVIVVNRCFGAPSISFFGDFGAQLAIHSYRYELLQSVAILRERIQP